MACASAEKSDHPWQSDHPCQAGGACECGGSCGGPKTALQKGMAAEQARLLSGTRFANATTETQMSLARQNGPQSALAMGLLQSSARWHKNPRQFLQQMTLGKNSGAADYADANYAAIVNQSAKWARDPAAFEAQHGAFAEKFGGKSVGKLRGGCAGCAKKDASGSAGSSLGKTAAVAPSQMTLAQSMANAARRFAAPTAQLLVPATATVRVNATGLGAAGGLAPQWARAGTTPFGSPYRRQDGGVASVQNVRTADSIVLDGMAADRQRWSSGKRDPGNPVTHPGPAAAGHRFAKKAPIAASLSSDWPCAPPSPPVYACDDPAGWDQLTVDAIYAYSKYLLCQNPQVKHAFDPVQATFDLLKEAVFQQYLCPLPFQFPFCVQCTPPGSSGSKCCPDGKCFVAMPGNTSRATSCNVGCSRLGAVRKRSTTVRATTP